MVAKFGVPSCSLPIISTSAKGHMPNAVQPSYQHSPWGLALGPAFPRDWQWVCSVVEMLELGKRHAQAACVRVPVAVLAETLRLGRTQKDDT